jgi:hypothetical protein
MEERMTKMNAQQLQYQEYISLGTGEYPCEIVGVEDVTSTLFTNVDGTPKSQVLITLDLLQPEFEDRSLRVYASRILTPRSKLFKDLAGPVIGSEWLKKNPFDPCSMIGLRVTTVVVEETKEDGTPFDKVIRFKPISDAWESEQGVTVEAVRLANTPSPQEEADVGLPKSEASSQQAAQFHQKDDIEY